MGAVQVIPKRKIDTLRKRLSEGRPANDLRRVETRVKAGRKNNIRLLNVQKDNHIML